MARSFSAALDDMFKMENSIADLDATVAEKKHEVVSHVDELEALEVKLRAAEERLKANGLAVEPRSPMKPMRIESILREANKEVAEKAAKEASISSPATPVKAAEDSSANQASMPALERRPPTPGASAADGQEVDAAEEEDEEEEEEYEEPPPKRPSRNLSKRLRAARLSTSS